MICQPPPISSAVLDKGAQFKDNLIDPLSLFRYHAKKRMKPMESIKRVREWLRQSSYDMKTAEAMFISKRYIYAVFMCHLSIEKMLKGLYAQMRGDVPPKSHNLVFLIEKMKLELPEDIYDFVFMLNGLSVPTRYPDDLQNLLKVYNKAKTRKVLDRAKEVLKWLKAKL
jgi:HEPN domain-containing protein